MMSNLRREIDLIHRHVFILKLVLENEPIGILKLSDLSHLPQHKVRYSLRVLEQMGLIRPSLHGAVSTKAAKNFLKTLPEEVEELIAKLEILRT
jgi:predicted transcriptional regulator